MICLVFGSKNVQFHNICSLQQNITISTLEVDPTHICRVGRDQGAILKCISTDSMNT